MMNDFKNLINQHCLESARTIHKNTDLKYYTVLGTIERNQLIGDLNLAAEFITNSEGWLEKFTIIACPINNSSIIILVSPECPQVYIEEPSDIINLVKDYEQEHAESITTCIKRIVDSSVLNDGCTYQPGTLISDPSTGGLWISNYDNTLTSITSSNITYTASNSIDEPGNISINLKLTL